MKLVILKFTQNTIFPKWTYEIKVNKISEAVDEYMDEFQSNQTKELKKTLTLRLSSLIM